VHAPVDYELHKRNGQGQLGNEASDTMRPIDHGLGFILTLCGRNCFRLVCVVVHGGECIC
jgi:hypothetical protein